MTKHAPILEASAVHDRRMLSVWLSATFAAGMVNTTTFLACQRFVTHVTGTLTLIGSDVLNIVLLLDYGLVTAAFMLGAMLSYWLIDGRRVLGKEPWPTIPLGLVALCLSIVAALGALGIYGPFGRTVETVGDFELLVMLAFAMGLQNASIATTTGMIVRTTHMTGPVTDFSVALAAWLSFAPKSIRDTARESVMLRGAKILFFIFGCAFSALVAPRLEYYTYFIPAVLLSLAGIRLHNHLVQFRSP